MKEIHTAVNNYDKVINSWESARNTLVDLNYWFDFIPRYDAISEEDQDVLVMQENVKDLAIRHQLRFLPEIRKYFGEYLSSRLAGLDYKITILNDERNKIIVFTHDSFTKRTLLEKFHNTVANDLRLLGFKQIRYKWYELEKLKEEKYILYNFSDLPDNEVRKFTISAIKN
ncbi:MAG: hypothetical protein M5T52_09745 [Ignavibacteriaceae bacterium]|nr:hypothetical protein [Ignavibacteriaceae bacterium]